MSKHHLKVLSVNSSLAESIARGAHGVNSIVINAMCIALLHENISFDFDSYVHNYIKIETCLDIMEFDISRKELVQLLVIPFPHLL